MLSLLQGSNVYSSSECCLLAWLAGHLQRAFPNHPARVDDFGADLSDGVVLFALLMNHWPALAVHKHKIRWGHSGEGGCEYVCSGCALVLTGTITRGLYWHTSHVHRRYLHDPVCALYAFLAHGW